MNIFFKTYQDYYTHRSIVNVRNDIQKIANRKWSDLSQNICGTLNSDGSFKLSQKWALVQIGGFERMPAYIEGTFLSEGGQTKIATSVRPNPMFILLFYGAIICFVCELAGIETFVKGPTYFKLLFFPICAMLSYWAIWSYKTGLKNRFEKILRLN